MTDLFEGKTILVTGGTGSIGSQLVKELLTFNVHKIIVFSRDEISQFIMQRKLNDERIDFVVGDVRDYRSIQRVFESFNIDIVYHAAAMKHVTVCESNPLEAVKTNILGTQNLVDLAKKNGISKFITISTDKAVNPSNVMGATKFIAEKITLVANYSCVRFGNVAGSRGSVIPVLLNEMITRKKITITDPNVTRFVMSIPEAVKLIIEATKYAKGGEVFVLKMESFKLSDIVDVLINNIASRLGINGKEIKIEIIGLVSGEKLHEELISDLEIHNLHDLGEMWMIAPQKTNAVTSGSVDLKYTSDRVKSITKEKLIEIIEEFLKQSSISIFTNRNY